MAGSRVGSSSSSSCKRGTFEAGVPSRGAGFFVSVRYPPDTIPGRRPTAGLLYLGLGQARHWSRTSGGDRCRGSAPEDADFLRRDLPHRRFRRCRLGAALYRPGRRFAEALLGAPLGTLRSRAHTTTVLARLVGHTIVSFPTMETMAAPRSGRSCNTLHSARIHAS